MINIGKVIGTPALLEQCAEECTELAQACLKMARKQRKENPTPLQIAELWESINEEVGDVENCIEALLNSDILSRSEINFNKRIKLQRWFDRINASKGENDGEKSSTDEL